MSLFFTSFLFPPSDRTIHYEALLDTAGPQLSAPTTFNRLCTNPAWFGCLISVCHCSLWYFLFYFLKLCMIGDSKQKRLLNSFFVECCCGSAIKIWTSCMWFTEGQLPVVSGVLCTLTYFVLWSDLCNYLTKKYLIQGSTSFFFWSFSQI